MRGVGCAHDSRPQETTCATSCAPHSSLTTGRYIDWYLLDYKDNECFEVTHLALDDSEYEQGDVLCVTKMAVQRGTKSWFALDEVKARPHGLQTWGQLVTDGTFKVIGFGDEAYVRISEFWRRHAQSPRQHKPDPAELVVEDEDDTQPDVN